MRTKFDGSVDHRIRFGEYENGKLTLSHSNRQKAWVAKITGTDPKYKLARSFENHAEEGGNYRVWDLEEGVLYNWHSDKRWGKTYGIAEEGELYIIDEKEAIEIAESL